MHVLVTGGAGFIGSHLAEYHLDRGDHVHVVDNLSAGSLDNISPLFERATFRFDQEDILTWSGLEMAIGRADRIYHMAAVVGVKKVLSDAEAVTATNIGGTERVLRTACSAHWNPQIVIASSSEVYGFNANASFSESDDVVLRSGGRNRWCYAVTKLADEYLAFAYFRKYGMNVVIARLFNTVGPHQTGKYGMVMPTFIKQAVANQPITVYGDGTQTRSFCDVRDTVAALDLLASSPDASGEIVNVGNGREIAIKDLAQLVLERANSNVLPHFVPYVEAYGEEFEDTTHRRPSLEKLHRLTGFVPDWTLERTIDDLIARERRAQGAQ